AAAGDALEDVTFSKVLAHATRNDVVEERIAAWQRDGNHAADALAKAGAAEGRLAEDERAFLFGCLHLARLLTRYTGRMEAVLTKAGTRDHQGLGRGLRARLGEREENRALMLQ
ncbi:unnamed protein product, partial [Prorocentrum cordatum]